MSDQIRFLVSDQPRQEDVDALVAGVVAFNDRMLGNDERSIPLAVFGTDARDEIIGGVAGRSIYGWFLIHVVWVDEAYRGCIGAQVDTVAFQAPEFYRKLGFEIIGEVPDCFFGHTRYFFSRRYD